jgi:hypothetical protein
MGGHSSKPATDYPAIAPQRVADTAGAKAKLTNTMVYLSERVSERTGGGIVAAAGELAALCGSKGFDDLVRVLAVQQGGLAAHMQPAEAGLAGAADTMPFCVVLLVSKADDFTTSMDRVSAADAAAQQVEPMVEAAAAHQMVGWFSPGDPTSVSDYGPLGARILSEVMQEYPAANTYRNNVYLVRVFNRQPLTSNFLSFGWMMQRSPYHISIQGGGNTASLSGDGTVMTLPISKIAKEALILSCFAEDTLVKGIGWCAACDPSGTTYTRAQIAPALADLSAKLDIAGQAMGAEDVEGHALTIFKFQCQGMSITPGEAISISNQACRSIGVLVRRPSASGSKDVQYYVMVEGGAYFLTAAILKVAGEEGAALGWNWPSSSIPIVPADIYDKPYVYGAVSQTMEAKTIEGMGQLIAEMNGISEPCSPIASKDAIMQMAEMLLEKGFTFAMTPLTVTGAAQNSILTAQDKADLLAPAVQSAMKSLVTPAASTQLAAT